MPVDQAALLAQDLPEMVRVYDMLVTHPTLATPDLMTYELLLMGAGNAGDLALGATTRSDARRSFSSH